MGPRATVELYASLEASLTTLTQIMLLLLLLMTMWIARSRVSVHGGPRVNVDLYAFRKASRHADPDDVVVVDEHVDC